MPNNPSNELELVPASPMPVAKPSAESAVGEIDIAGMFQALITSGKASENSAALESLVKLAERMEDRKAEREFAQAFNALQAEMPNIQAKTPVPNNDGTLRYKFAAFEDIMAQLKPLLLKHHFTVSFSMRYEADRLIEICNVEHHGAKSSHRRSNEFAVRVGHGPPKATETQADGAAATYAKRFALCNAFNILIETDTDARAEGGVITKEQADELERRVALLNANKAAFLEFAHATSFATIPAAVYPIADDFLRRKEQKGR